MDNQQPNISIQNAPQSNGDHDLLLTIKAEMGTKLDRVIADVKDLNDNFAGRVALLENKKIDRDTFDTYCTTDAKEFADYKTDHDQEFEEYKRITTATILKLQAQVDSHTKVIQYGLGALAVIQFVLGYIILAHLGNTPL